MSILNSPNILHENLRPVGEAPKHFPVRCSRQTLERWMRRGSNGVVLESVTIGSRRYTSIEAIGRFLSAQAGTPTNKGSLSDGRPRSSGGMSEREMAAKRREYGMPES